jgi:hypothetical protein
MAPARPGRFWYNARTGERSLAKLAPGGAVEFSRFPVYFLWKITKEMYGVVHK